ncbi:MAG: hypothetical protein IJY61_08630 [Candidatus Gastranaerophilales bacterium]|nr:hypothetical protein [Candidatus Gastranaerophilales bacterium]
MKIKLSNSKKNRNFSSKKLGFYKEGTIIVSMGGCSSRALTSVQTCCGTCCC